VPSTSALVGAFGLEYDSGQRSCQPDHSPVRVRNSMNLKISVGDVQLARTAGRLWVCR
jgi:hypothetical protein